MIITDKRLQIPICACGYAHIDDVVMRISDMEKAFGDHKQYADLSHGIKSRECAEKYYGIVVQSIYNEHCEAN
jgi:hypothetical protein